MKPQQQARRLVLGTVGAVLVLLGGAATPIAKTVEFKIEYPNAVKDSKPVVSGTFVLSSRDAAGPVIHGKWHEELRAVDFEVAIKQGSVKGEFVFSARLDFSRYLKAGEKKNIQIVLTTDSGGEFKNVKVSG